MLLKNYKLEMFRPKCNPNFQSVHCVAKLGSDISEALPYLGTCLGGGQYIKYPPSLTLRMGGKLITLHANEIFLNALNEISEAEKIVEWLKKEINDAWDNKVDIDPMKESPPEPRMIDILRLLPLTNCKKCGEATCMVFAVKALDGAKGYLDCTDITEANRETLKQYLSSFILDF